MFTTIGTLEFIDSKYVQLLAETVEECGARRKDWPEVIDTIVESGLILNVAHIVVDFLSHGKNYYLATMATSEDLKLSFDRTNFKFLTIVEKSANRGELQHMIDLRENLKEQILEIVGHRKYDEFCHTVFNGGDVFDNVKDILIYYVKLHGDKVRICTG